MKRAILEFFDTLFKVDCRLCGRTRWAWQRCICRSDAEQISTAPPDPRGPLRPESRPQDRIR